jgi:hypothetical protein
MKASEYGGRREALGASIFAGESLHEYPGAAADRGRTCAFRDVWLTRRPRLLSWVVGQEDSRVAAGTNHGSRPGCLWVLLCVGALSIFGCCLLPPLVLRPAVDVNTFHPEKGMTADEMRAKYGPPSVSSSNQDGSITWYYYTDRFGLGFHCVGVNFDASGRVESNFNH